MSINQDFSDLFAELNAAGARYLLVGGYAIAVHAATPDTPLGLLSQLDEGGRLVAPVAAGDQEVLMAFAREPEGILQRTIGPVRFVPLIGEEGFDA